MLAAIPCTTGVCDVHLVAAFLVVAGWFVIFVWGLVQYIRKREPGRGFWRLIGVMQGILLIQIVVGVIVFATGERAGTFLHYFYGGIFPAIVLGITHVLARDMNVEADRWKVFAVASFFIFGLTLRAMMTGLGLP